VIELAREHDIDIICSDDPHGPGRLVAERISADNQPLGRYLSRAPEPPGMVADLYRFVDHQVINLMTVDRYLKTERFAEALDCQMDGRVKILKTAYPERDMTVLDVMAPDCTKAKALDVLVRRYRLTPAEVMAVGDNQNDLDMLEYAGVGVVMGNADERIRGLGYSLTASNDKDGLAEAINRFLLIQDEN
jgi:hydroxymethylpyrimidine pyrophosphatase-like HAD family hydrolase